MCAETFWAVPATAGPEYLGTLALRSGPDLPEGDRLILERAAMVTALLLLQGRSVVEAEQRVRGELLGDLLDAPHQDTESLRARGLRLGVDLDRPHLVVVVHAEPELWPAADDRLREECGIFGVFGNEDAQAQGRRGSPGRDAARSGQRSRWPHGAPAAGD